MRNEFRCTFDEFCISIAICLLYFIFLCKDLKKKTLQNVHIIYTFTTGIVYIVFLDFWFSARGKRYLVFFLYG